MVYEGGDPAAAAAAPAKATRPGCARTCNAAIFCLQVGARRLRRILAGGLASLRATAFGGVLLLRPRGVLARGLSRRAPSSQRRRAGRAPAAISRNLSAGGGEIVPPVPSRSVHRFDE